MLPLTRKKREIFGRICEEKIKKEDGATGGDIESSIRKSIKPTY
jgi:hypothetical protein